MHVIMVKTAAGPHGVFVDGRTYEVDDEFGEQLIAANAARRTTRSNQYKTATQPVARRATRKDSEQ